ncbi:MAG: M20/M25/M40 family metallo-hydrolase, partial [Ardenticatenales bacterium]|nr:M20/M25/M40 family metallo-hydrolase [Ardenticatenales bacterium]
MNRNPVELAQALIRFDTSNPPGNEAACVAYVNGLLTQVGIETTLLARSPQRPNLIARLPGEGRALPLLLYGHLDVVPTTNQLWSHPPFEGVIEDGYLWGRGALDMKGGVAMMLAAFLRAKDEGLRPAGDILFALLSDEEGGGDDGAKFLVEQHPEHFAGVRHAIGEFGGFTLHLGGQRFYPIQVVEKQVCWMKIRVSGPAGHGSLPMRGGAMAKVARLLQQVEQHRLPVHVTAPARTMIEGMAASLPLATRQLLRQLLIPTMT